MSEKINCDCGGKYTKKHKSEHIKTKIHLKWLDEGKVKEEKKVDFSIVKKIGDKLFKCGCGATIKGSATNIHRHQQKKKHIDWANNNIKDTNYTCECGSTLTKAKKKRHEQTKKHLAFLEDK
jgi:hypothetical protein